MPLLACRLAAVLCLVAPLGALAREPKKIDWRFDADRDRAGNPVSVVILLVDGAAIPIRGRSGGEFHILAKEEFKEHHIPANALGACAGWWAGAGDDYYVSLRGGFLDVFHRPLDEMVTPSPRYQRVRRIRMSEMP